MMCIEANGTIGGLTAIATVIYTGLATVRGFVSAVNAKSGLGGNNFPTFGTSFQCHTYSSILLNNLKRLIDYSIFFYVCQPN